MNFIVVVHKLEIRSPQLGHTSINNILKIRK